MPDIRDLLQDKPGQIGRHQERQDQSFFEHDDDNLEVRLREGWGGVFPENLTVGAAVLLEGILAKADDYTVTDSDGWIINVTTGASDRTITLPTAADNTGRVITVRKVDDGAGNVIIDGEGSEEIAGATTLTMEDEGSCVTLQCNGTSWDWIGGHIRGSNANGDYIRFSSGVQVCWHDESFTLAVNNAYGNMYTSSLQSAFTFPKAFSSTARYTMAMRESPVLCWLGTTGSSSSTATCQWYVVKGTSGLSVSGFVVSYIAIGPWA